MVSLKASERSNPKGAHVDHHRLVNRLGLAGVLMLAFGLRVYGIGFGLPQLYYWDEPEILNRAVQVGGGDLNPHFFIYPTLYIYVLAFVSGFYFFLQRAIGNLHDVEQFAVEYFVDPSGVYLSARLATCLVGTACVLLMYHAGRELFGRTTGLLAALFLAVSALHSSFSVTTHVVALAA